MNAGNSPDLMGLLQQRMAYDNQRSSVLAENVANASTPGYKARDLAAFSFGDALKQTNVGMATTDPRHIVPASMAGVNARTVPNKAYEAMPSGNAVDLPQEMMKVSQTSVDYQEVTSIYKKMTGLFKIAIKGTSN